MAIARELLNASFGEVFERRTAACFFTGSTGMRYASNITHKTAITYSVALPMALIILALLNTNSAIAVEAYSKKPSVNPTLPMYSESLSYSK